MLSFSVKPENRNEIVPILIAVWDSGVEHFTNGIDSKDRVRFKDSDLQLYEVTRQV